MKNFKAYFTAVMVGLIFAAGVTFAAGESRFRDLIVRTAASIGTSSAANSKAVLDLVSTTKGFLPPRMTEVQRDAIATPPQGLIVFNTTTQTLNQYNGTAWEEIGGGGSGVGGINFIENTDFETNITGYNTYADAAAATPVDGTGGSSSLTLSQTTTAGEVQRGAASLKIAKGAVNEQGEGVSYDFTVDGIDNAASKKIIVTFDYETSANYASDEIRLFVYDRDAATLQAVLNSDSGNLKFCTTGCKFVGEFYTTSGSNDYRLIWHVAGTSATAYDVYIDNIRAGPDSPTPTAIVQDLGTENWTDSEANATTSVRLTRIGNQISAVGTITFTGGADNDGVINITIPTKYTADSVYSFSNSRSYPVGFARQIDNGTATYESFVNLASATTLQMQLSAASSTFLTTGQLTSSQPFTWVSGDSATFQASWIVSGWQSSALVSTTEAVVSTVKARYTRITAQSLNSATIMDFSTKDYDTHNAVTTGSSWKFTAPKTGYYKVRAGLQFVTRSYTVGHAVAIQLFKNGAFYSQSGALTTALATGNYIMSSQHADTVYLRQGEYIDYRATNGAGATDSSFMEIAIEEDPDFSVFGVYGNFELLTATSATKTPSATNNYHALSGNSIALTAGTWRLFGQAAFNASGGAATYDSTGVGFYAANGADTSSTPALLSTVPGLTILSSHADDNANFVKLSTTGSGFIPAPNVIVRCASSCTVFLVTYATMTTAANARINVYATAERLQ